MKKLVFVSYRTGRPQIFFEDRATGELVQATDRDDLADWSITPSNDGRFVYFSAGTAGWRVNLDSFEEEPKKKKGAVEMREKGMVGAAMGTTALSKAAAGGRCRWLRRGDALHADRHRAEDLARGPSERDTIGHPQFCPDDDNLLLYAGPLIPHRSG